MEEAFRLFKSTREYLTPVLTETAFHERGLLTPEEFVLAGDQLVRTCPSWRWESGESSKFRSYLPNNKQFLMTHGIPSYSRVMSLTSAKIVEESIKGEMGDQEGDWCAPDVHKPDDNNNDNIEDDEVLVEVEDTVIDNSTVAINAKKILSLQIKDTSSPSTIFTTLEIQREDEYLDMEDESLALDDASTCNYPSSSCSVVAANNNNSNSNSKNTSNLLRARHYDVSITYDNYYRTPRIWLFGFNENGTPLSSTDIFQDIIQDYAKKTVTIEPHPHLSRPHASIHPCQHGSAMLNIIHALKECNHIPNVEQYIFIFLKFIQSVIPTIEYDYTFEVKVMGKEKL